MNKLSAKAFRLSAIAALIVLGGGVTPVQAGWQLNAVHPPDASITVGQAHAYTLRYGSGVTHEDKPGSTPASFVGAIQRKFDWIPVNGSTPGTQSVNVQVDIAASCPLQIIVDPVTNGFGSSTTVLGVNGRALTYSAVYDYTVTPNVVRRSATPNLSSILFAKPCSVAYDPITGKYSVDASFDFNVSTTADVQSNYVWSSAQGMAMNYFVADAKAGSASITSTSIQIVP